jgi:hypothetical protein
MEGNKPLRMSPAQEMPQRVVIFEDVEPAPPPHVEKVNARQLFLILCLLLTSALAYLVFSGLLKF